MDYDDDSDNSLEIKHASGASITLGADGDLLSLSHAGSDVSSLVGSRNSRGGGSGGNTQTSTTSHVIDGSGELSHSWSAEHRRRASPSKLSPNTKRRSRRR